MRDLGGYKLHERISAGSEGTVYRAVDADGRTVALKVFDGDDSQHLIEYLGLDNLVSAYSKVDSPFIAKTYDYFIADEAPVIAMEFVDGPTLEEYLNDSKTLEFSELLNILADIASALFELNEARIQTFDLNNFGNFIVGQGPPTRVVMIDLAASPSSGSSLLHGEQFYETAQDLFGHDHLYSLIDRHQAMAVFKGAIRSKPSFREIATALRNMAKHFDRKELERFSLSSGTGLSTKSLAATAEWPVISL